MENETYENNSLATYFNKITKTRCIDGTKLPILQTSPLKFKVNITA